MFLHQNTTKKWWWGNKKYLLFFGQTYHTNHMQLYNLA